MDQEPQSIILFPTTEILASTHRMRRYIKLIDLYEKHECLWNQFSKDFFNFELRNKIWSEIAEQMKKNSSPDTWKCILHSLRYNVEIERLREQEASFYNMRVELAPKLVYAEKFKFLKRMYMGGHATMKVPHVLVRRPAVGNGEILNRKKEVRESYYTSKLKSLESLRNSRSSLLCLTPETYRKLNMSSADVAA